MQVNVVDRLDMKIALKIRFCQLFCDKDSVLGDLMVVVMAELSVGFGQFF